MIVLALVIAASLAIVFYAGCVGDTKAATRGDPVRALYYENIAIGLGSLALALSVALVALFRSMSLGVRMVCGFLVLCVFAPILWLFELQVEVWGVRWCF